MGCCGKISTMTNIVKGNLAVALDIINLLPPEAFLYHQFRIETCQKCAHRTGLTDAEYIQWVKENGGLKKFIAEIDSLENWPPLPIRHEQRPQAKLFCSLCKCWIKAKAYVKQENCPIGHPGWRKPQCFFNTLEGDNCRA